MTQIGHSLTGLAVLAFAMPQGCGRQWKIIAIISFIAIANLPDWQLPNWGHDRYYLSHSVFVNGGLIAVCLLAWLGIRPARSHVPLSCAVLASVAWLSHLLLDSFYNHGNGIAIYWPFSTAKLNFSMPWFNTLDKTQPFLSTHNLSVYLVELIAFTPILVLAIAIRTSWSKYRQQKDSSPSPKAVECHEPVKESQHSDRST